MNEMKLVNQRESWLASLKAGDEVVIRTGYGIPVYEHGVVAKTTPAQIVVGRWRYWRKNGDAVGHKGWSANCIMQPTQEICDEVESRKLRARLRDWRWDTTELDALRAVARALGITLTEAKQ